MLEMSSFHEVLADLEGLPPILVYLFAGLGAAIENFFPPVPADTFVLVGAFVAAAGRPAPGGIFLATWLANVGSALAVYLMGWRWGRGFFATPAGHWLLRPKQLQRLERLYERHGFKIIFLSRFLPGFRAVVPVFAGISRLGFWRTSLPLAAASAIWYGLLVYLGTLARQHLDEILHLVSGINTTLAVIAAIIALALAVLWASTRHERGEGADSGGASR